MGKFSLVLMRREVANTDLLIERIRILYNDANE